MKFCQLAFCGLLLGSPAWTAPQENHPAVPSKFAGEVAQFAARPAPEPGGILLVGSSIFKRWTNAVQDLAPLPVTNRAFGGSQTSHQLMFFDQVVPPCRPDLIVWYCGSNDVKGGKDPEIVLARTREWIGKVQATLPGTGVLLVSVMNSPQKRRHGQSEAVLRLNRGLAGLAKTEERIYFLEVNPALEGPETSAREELYVEDGLHLNMEGYRQFTSVLKPAIEKFWKHRKEPPL